MRMNRARVLAIAACALFTAPAGAATGCALPGARTVASNAQARVFAVPGKGATKLRYFGCLTGRKPILLTTDQAPKAADQNHVVNDTFRLAGPWVAWHFT